MIPGIELKVDRQLGDWVFSFLNGPVSFVTFVVVDPENEKEMWKLSPVGMGRGDEHDEHEEGAVRFFSAQVTPQVATAFRDLLLEVTDSQTGQDEAPVTEVVYGQVPKGYKEDVPAAELEAGRDYNVIVLKVLDVGAETFTA